MERSNFVPKPNDNFQWFFYWVCERMNMFWRRYNGEVEVTDDEILKNSSFTNVYRCLDRTSQYLIKNVIYNGKKYEPEDMFFRIILFKHFNECATWDFLEKELGDITYNTGWDNIASVCDENISNGETIYNGAYMLTCFFMKWGDPYKVRGMSKHRAHFKVFEEKIFQSGFIYDLLEEETFEGLFQKLKSLGVFGEFLSQQYALDLNYSELYNFSENDFVVPGPGSKNGIKFTFDGVNTKYNYIGTIKWVREVFEENIDRFCKDTGMRWNPLPWEKVPTLTNIQNCFCETFKYAKGMGYSFKKDTNERLRKKYRPKNSSIDFVFPPKWNAVIPKRGELIV